MNRTPPAKRAAKIEVTAEQRYHLINDVAYFRSIGQQQKSGAADNPAESWYEVEAEIDAALKREPAKQGTRRRTAGGGGDACVRREKQARAPRR